MTRERDKAKYDYAKTLIAQNIPIQKIRKELKEVFGSGISPNTLLEMKEEIDKENKKKERPLPTALRSILGGKSEAQKEVELFNNLLAKFDAKLESNRLLMQKYKEDNLNLEQKIENLIKTYVSSEVEYKKNIEGLRKLYTLGKVKLLDETEIEAHFFEKKMELSSKILQFIQTGEKTKEEILQKFNVSQKLIEHTLFDLIGQEKVFKIERDSMIHYTSHLQENAQQKEGFSDFEQFFREGISGPQLLFYIDIYSQKVEKFIENQARSVEDIMSALGISPEFSRLLLYKMFLEDRIEVFNSTKIPRKIILKQYDKHLNGATQEEITEEILKFLSQKYGQVNPYTNKFEVNPVNVIKALNQIGELWPLNSFKYQNIDETQQFQEDSNPSHSNNELEIHDLTGLNQFHSPIRRDNK